MARRAPPSDSFRSGTPLRARSSEERPIIDQLLIGTDPRGFQLRIA